MADNFTDNGDSAPDGISGQQAGNQSDLPSSGILPGTTYAQQHFAQNHELQEQLSKFWSEMRDEVDKVGTDPAEFKSQQLPLARIKKIMKSDEDVRMISAEAPVLFAKACEFFIHEMTLRAWNAAEEHKRRTLQRGDIATAISRTEVWDFLLDSVPLEGEAAAAVEAAQGEGGASGPSSAAPGAAGAAAGAAPPAGGAGVAAVPPPQLPPGMGMFPGQFMPPGMPGMPQMPPPGMIPPNMSGPGGVPMIYPGMAPGMFMAPPPPGAGGQPRFGQMLPPQQPQQGDN
ncbi:hypothetical protein Ndes2526B_g06373 [Nannochloris sp. 'desiccata']|nr:hypothetical protein KSW81_008138 [Chlorella desiccata (nom. nud.)]KAH7619400.1 putative Nuclear transcription factor Y subunit C-4 [Chlorella desiccata (nom. nud.)]